MIKKILMSVVCMGVVGGVFAKDANPKKNAPSLADCVEVTMFVRELKKPFPLKRQIIVTCKNKTSICYLVIDGLRDGISAMTCHKR